MTTLLANHEALQEAVGQDRLRQRAWSLLEQRGLPGKQHENWKYSGTRDVVETNYALAKAEEIHHQADRRFDLECHRLEFMNGYLQGQLPVVIEGVQIKRCVDNHSDLLDADFDTDTIARNGFAALNLALHHDAILIEVPDNVSATLPLHLVFRSGKAATAIQTHPLILIRLGRHARLQLIESHVGDPGTANFINQVIHADIGENACLEHLRLIEGLNDDRRVANQLIQVRRDGRYLQHGINLGGKFTRNDIRVQLMEPGAAADLNGLFLVSNNQHTDNHLLVEHLAPHTLSTQSYRGVADDRGHGVFNGKVYVARDAQKISAEQASNNLLLAKMAEIDTKPELEIYADDVKCAHGATIGQLDENMLFYLRSRGLDEATARALLIFAFVDSILAGIPYAKIRDYLETQMVGRLPDADVVRSFLGDVA